LTCIGGCLESLTVVATERARTLAVPPEAYSGCSV
jgi:hypothetical protein